MNKKAKKPKFQYPFTDKEHEESCKFLTARLMNTVSDKGSRVELTETVYTGGYRKIELKETLYIKKKDMNNFGEVLYLRPYDQIRMKKLLDFVVLVQRNGKMFLSRKGLLDRPLEFTPDQQAIFRLFYERRGVTLEDAIEILGTYTSTESLRQTIRKMNRRIIGWFKLTSKDEFINGTFHKNRSGYSFNPNIRLEYIDDRLIAD